MKRILFAILMAWSVTALAENVQYTMRVDGMACPYCAYGIEKKLKAIEGIQSIDIDLDKGLVIVISDQSVDLSDKKMTSLFQDAGFTFRSMKKAAVVDED
ncbi:MAG: heavy-metal-associated domain-containing protein [Xanthomonadales bacterium]|nr:heavy-metal-associated domain-containing protein [Xanthomonadales bacterium]